MKKLLFLTILFTTPNLAAKVTAMHLDALISTIQKLSVRIGVGAYDYTALNYCGCQLAKKNNFNNMSPESKVLCEDFNENIEEGELSKYYKFLDNGQINNLSLTNNFLDQETTIRNVLTSCQNMYEMYSKTTINAFSRAMKSLIVSDFNTRKINKIFKNSHSENSNYFVSYEKLNRRNSNYNNIFPNYLKQRRFIDLSKKFKKLLPNNRINLVEINKKIENRFDFIQNFNQDREDIVVNLLQELYGACKVTANEFAMTTSSVVSSRVLGKPDVLTRIFGKYEDQCVKENKEVVDDMELLMSSLDMIDSNQVESASPSFYFKNYFIYKDHRFKTDHIQSGVNASASSKYQCMVEIQRNTELNNEIPSNYNNVYGKVLTEEKVYLNLKKMLTSQYYSAIVQVPLANFITNGSINNNGTLNLDFFIKGTSFLRENAFKELVKFEKTRDDIKEHLPEVYEVMDLADFSKGLNNSTLMLNRGKLTRAELNNSRLYKYLQYSEGSRHNDRINFIVGVLKRKFSTKYSFMVNEVVEEVGKLYCLTTDQKKQLIGDLTNKPWFLNKDVWLFAGEVIASASVCGFALNAMYGVGIWSGMSYWCQVGIGVAFGLADTKLENNNYHLAIQRSIIQTAENSMSASAEDLKGFEWDNRLVYYTSVPSAFIDYDTAVFTVHFFKKLLSKSLFPKP